MSGTTPAIGRMATEEGTAPAQEAAEPGVEALMDKTVAAAEARAKEPEVKTEEKPKDGEKKVEAKPERKGPTKGEKTADIVEREWKAQQAEKNARTILDKYKDLDEALSKKDARGALLVLAKAHGLTFADFVKVLTDAEEAPEKSAAEIAAETVKAELAKRDEETKTKEAEEAQKSLQTRLTKMYGSIEEQAAADPTRWELAGMNPECERTDDGRKVLVGEFVWDIIEKHFAATGEKLQIADVLDLTEKKLREKRDARRPKQDGQKPGEAKREEAASERVTGGAAEPAFTHRTTSGGSSGGAGAATEDVSDAQAVSRFLSRRRSA